MTNQHPITPPYELIEEWIKQFKGDHPIYIATQAAQWGADQELEACCLLLDNGEYAASYGCHDGTSLRAARRPKPPSLKEQALEILQRLSKYQEDSDWDTIRRALEALPE
jgi:predicted HD phosphohydrolase